MRFQVDRNGSDAFWARSANAQTRVNHRRSRLKSVQCGARFASSPGIMSDSDRHDSSCSQRDSRNAVTLSTPCLLTLEIKLVSIAPGNAEQFEELPCAN